MPPAAPGAFGKKPPPGKPAGSPSFEEALPVEKGPFPSDGPGCFPSFEEDIPRRIAARGVGERAQQEDPEDAAERAGASDRE